ncbi:hypothetical protein QN239_32000 [Mycolicibacterium sp. Y3]
MTAVIEGSVAVVSRSVEEALAAGVPEGAVVCAPLPDGAVTGWPVVQNNAVAGAERQCAVVRLDGRAVAVAGAVSEVMVAGDPVPTEGEMPAWASALAAEYWVSRRCQVEAAAARSALLDHEARLERIVDAAHEYASDNDLCERFDRFMMAQGLRPRSRDYVCEVDVTVRVRIPVASHSADAAGSEVTERMVAAAIADLRGSLLADAIQEHDVVDVEED